MSLPGEASWWKRNGPIKIIQKCVKLVGGVSKNISQHVYIIPVIGWTLSTNMFKTTQRIIRNPGLPDFQVPATLQRYFLPQTTDVSANSMSFKFHVALDENLLKLWKNTYPPCYMAKFDSGPKISTDRLPLDIAEVDHRQDLSWRLNCEGWTFEALLK